MSGNASYLRHIRKSSINKSSFNSSKDLCQIDAINNSEYRQSNIKTPMANLTHSLKLRKFEQYFSFNNNKFQLQKKQIVNVDKLSQLPHFIPFEKSHTDKINQSDNKITKTAYKDKNKNMNNQNKTTIARNDSRNSENKFIVQQQNYLSNSQPKPRYQSQEIQHSQVNNKYPPYYHQYPARLKLKLYKDLNFHSNKLQASNSPILLKKTIVKSHTLQNWINRRNPHNLMTNKFFLDLIFITHSMLFQEINSMNYYNVYVEQGNNQQLIKRIVRKRSGWRVVETPDVANFIWTQRYKKSYANRPRRSEPKNQQFQSPNHQDKNKKTSIKDAMKIQQIYPAKVERAASVKVHHRKRSKNNSDINYDTLSAQSKTNSLLIENVYKQFNAQCQKITKKCGQKLELNKLTKYKVSSNILMLNHLPGHRSLSDKKNLLDNVIHYCSKNNENPFSFLPFTIKMTNVQELNKFPKQQNSRVKMWIVKPGEDSNRGREIVVCNNWTQVQSQITTRFQGTSDNRAMTGINKIRQIRAKTIIVQQYIMPLLYQQRKFDIRMYMLVTNFNQVLRGYLYDDGYLRTCSFKFNPENDNCYVHLTNDAIQSKCYEYGKYEEGNKLPLKFLNKILKQNQREDSCKNLEDVWTQMKSICTTLLKATKDKITKQIDENKSSNSDNEKEKPIHFELFGLDYLLDQYQKLWLIQVNTNPCLQTSQSRILNRVIPQMLDNVMKLAVQPCMRTLNQKDSIINNKFHIVYEQ